MRERWMDMIGLLPAVLGPALASIAVVIVLTVLAVKRGKRPLDVLPLMLIVGAANVAYFEWLFEASLAETIGAVAAVSVGLSLWFVMLDRLTPYNRERKTT